MIPIIDFQDKALAQKLDKAYTTVGFAVIKNPFAPAYQAVFNHWFEIAQAFFALDVSVKKQYPYSGVRTNLGYSAWLQENVDPTNPSDMKESFNYSHRYRMIEKLWPQELADFRHVAEQTLMLADSLTLSILSIFEQILSVAPYTLTHCHIHNYSTTRIIHYPAYEGDVELGQLRIGEHSDYGTITLLWQINDVPGLQVCDLAGNWHSVPYVKNGVIVNVGDLLQRWTNDYFVSTKHRVVNSHLHLPRYSMAHFVDPIPGTIIENLGGERAKYQPIESLAYLTQRLENSY